MALTVAPLLAAISAGVPGPAATSRILGAGGSAARAMASWAKNSKRGSIQRCTRPLPSPTVPARPEGHRQASVRMPVTLTSLFSLANALTNAGAQRRAKRDRWSGSLEGESLKPLQPSWT
jgi:hypothetical protein